MRYARAMMFGGKQKLVDIGFFFKLSNLFIVVIISAITIFSGKSVARDTLTASERICVGQTLVSSGQIFELGFFTPGNSSKEPQYIGIWFKTIAARKIVWVGNRDNPLTAFDTASSCLRIVPDGNLIVVDGTDTTVWSTSVSPKINSTTYVVLKDNGNLILKDNISGSTLWESFNHPGDTSIPGIVLRGNNVTGEKHYLSSWKRTDEPSQGIFSVWLSTETPPQIVVLKSSKPYWKSGPWDGSSFIGIHDTGLGYSNGLAVSQDSRQSSPYVIYNPPTVTHTAIFYIAPSGNLIRSDWDLVTGVGNLKWQSIVIPCDVYGTCGPFGVCNRHGSGSCECLKGFIPKSMEEWAKGNWESGCVRRAELHCEYNMSSSTRRKAKIDGFSKLSSMKLPDNFRYFFGLDSSGCKQKCLNNCSCVAYAFPDAIGCMIWYGDLVDTQHFSYGGADLFLRLVVSELGEKKMSTKIIISLTALFGVILSGVFVFCLHMWRVNQRAKRHHTTMELDLLLPRVDMTRTELTDLLMVDLNSLIVATNNFSETNKLGGGGFGSVYKGKLEGGLEIAVKRLSCQSEQGGEEFRNEISLISKLQHRNLVRLLGYCIKEDEKLLIYEYMKNKSLDAWLFDTNRAVELDWSKRFNIIEGIARGLLYLHRDSRLRIIHRDLKASNILLDDNMDPKISDFGLARSFQVTQQIANTQRVVGTFGYISPEYAMRGILSERSDVYSFGVLLLEIISGMRNSSFHDHENHSLLGYAWNLRQEGRGIDLMDQALGDSCLAADFMHCMQIGLLCVQYHSTDRPTMSAVVFMLTNEAHLPEPKPPICYQDLESEAFISQSNSIVSMHDISTLVGR